MNDRKVRYGARSREMRIQKDSDAVFDAAIRAGVLSTDPEEERFAGHYMYMHHDGDGAAWFKHRETRVYVTMPSEAAEPPAPVDAKRITGPGSGLWATVVLAGVFVAGALINPDRGPSIGTVRLNELTAEFLADAVQGTDSPEVSARAARAWGTELERALDAVADRNGVVLLPVEAVAAGAADYTVEVRAAMRSWRTAGSWRAADPGIHLPASEAAATPLPEDGG